MVKPEDFFSALQQAGIDFYTGVPDSLLKAFCAYVSDNLPSSQHVIAANEGGAVALGIGYHLATTKVAAVYMQNSGLGNIVNPLLSLADPEVYCVPLLLIIGWRGEPGQKDEPQHLKQGRVTLSQLDSMEIPYGVMPSNLEGATELVQKAQQHFQQNNSPFAIVVPKNTFDKYETQNQDATSYDLTREEAIKQIVLSLKPDDVVVSTTGMASRELFEIREALGHDHSKDFLTVGGMGHTATIALGIAKSLPSRRVICIDGDGAAIMHLGAMAIIAQEDIKNFTHIIINNGAHDSVGGQPTVGFKINFPQVASALGYQDTHQCIDQNQLPKQLEQALASNNTALLEIRVQKGSRKDLGRPSSSPVENKTNFMAFLQS